MKYRIDFITACNLYAEYLASVITLNADINPLNVNKHPVLGFNDFLTSDQQQRIKEIGTAPDYLSKTRTFWLENTRYEWNEFESVLEYLHKI